MPLTSSKDLERLYEWSRVDAEREWACGNIRHRFGNQSFINTVYSRRKPWEAIPFRESESTHQHCEYHLHLLHLTSFRVKR